jgi:hypothetical protein
MMWNCCVIKNGQVAKKTTPTFFFFWGCETEPNPPLEFEKIFTNFIQDSPSNWTYFWSRDDALSRCFGRGACLASRHKHTKMNVM